METETVSYDPAQCLQEEVNRFKATNQFNAMQVTGFYLQAAVVLDQLKAERETIAALKRSIGLLVTNNGGPIQSAEAESDGGPDDYVMVAIDDFHRIEQMFKAICGVGE